MITNQSGIARGYFNWSDYERVNNLLPKLFGLSALLAGIYANEHGPLAPAGSWRKPRPTMMLEASQKLNLDLERSLLVGDRLSYLEAGTNTGLQTVIRLQTGHGQSERALIKEWTEQQQKGFSQN